jgi:hypothetical protein
MIYEFVFINEYAPMIAAAIIAVSFGVMFYASGKQEKHQAIQKSL